MKPSRIFAILSMAIVCALSASCSEDASSSPSTLYGSSVWFASYLEHVSTPDGGEPEERQHTIGISFNEDASSCSVFTGVVGYESANLTNYPVKWKSHRSFVLYDEQHIKCYSGKMVDSTTMSLNMFGIRTVELTPWTFNCETIE